MGCCSKTANGLALLAVFVEVGSDLLKVGSLEIVGNLLGLLLASNKKGYCQTLGQILFSTPEHERTALQTRVANWGGFTLAARFMRQQLDDPEVCRECAYFYCAMANFNRDASLIGGQSDAVPVLIEAMRRHPQHSGLQAQGSASMGCWCDWTPETEERVAALGGPQAILAALKTFPADAHVQFLGWAGLSSNSNRIPSKKLIIKAGAFDTGMEIMRDPALRHGFRVRQEIIMTFNNLAANCEECGSQLMGTGDIIQQVIEAMVEEVPDAERGTKADGIQLMGTLTKENRTTRAAVFAANFVPHAVAAMNKFPQRHPQNAWPLSEFGLYLFMHLSEDDKEAQAALVKAGAVDAIKLVMSTHPDSGERRHLGNILLQRLQAS